jgi:hypothetical protein
MVSGWLLMMRSCTVRTLWVPVTVEMLAGMVSQEDQPPVLPTAKLPTGALDGLSSMTSTRPLTPPAAPEATRASNWSDPDPKLTPAYSR